MSLGPDGRSRGFGTVTFANDIDAERAVQLFNGYDYHGRKLKVYYDKFSSQTPILTSLGAAASPQPLSAFSTTPVQSAQATLLQAAQLQQLVGGDRANILDASSGASLGVGLGLGTADRDPFYGLGSTSRPTTAGNPTESRSPLGLATTLQTLQDSLQQLNTRNANAAADVDVSLPGTAKSTSPHSNSRSPFDSFSLGSSPGLSTAVGAPTTGTSSLAERRHKVPAPLSASSSRPTSGSGSGSGSGLGNLTELSITTALSASTAVPNGDLLAHSTSPISPAREKATCVSAGVYGGGLEARRKSFANESTAVPPISTSSLNLSSSRPTTSTSSSAIEPPNKAESRSERQEQVTTSPRQSHPAHPGPIALPPPAPLPAFPPHMQHHMQPMSPLISPGGMVYPGYPLMSPPIPAPGYQIPGQGHVAMTPHGLPPITPSMPSFSFVPLPSPGGAGAEGPQGGYDHPVGPSALMSPPVPHAHVQHHQYGQQGQHQHHLPRHVFQPFTPGPPSTMSPGAFWGRPGTHAHAPYLNPAVGSPVLMQASHPYGTHQQSGLVNMYGSQPSSPASGPFAYGVSGAGVEEPSGYFPPVPPPPEGYFPPVGALGNVADEILREGSTMASESQKVDEADRPPHTRSESDTSNSNSAGDEHDQDSDGLLGHGRGARAHSSSSGATSWRSSEETVTKGDGATAIKEKDALSALAGDLAAFRLGARPPTRERRGESALSTSPSGSYAAAAAKAARPGSSGSSQSTANGAATRSASLGAENAPARPPPPQKTHSDETGAQVKASS